MLFEIKNHHMIILELFKTKLLNTEQYICRKVYSLNVFSLEFHFVKSLITTENVPYRIYTCNLSGILIQYISNCSTSAQFNNITIINGNIRQFIVKPKYKLGLLLANCRSFFNHIKYCKTLYVCCHYCMHVFIFFNLQSLLFTTYYQYNEILHP